MPVLDFADDHGQSLMTALGAPPEFLKTAAWVEPAEALDRDFALILRDPKSGEEVRKYASHDAGNTAVSMFYLTQAQGFLGAAALKTAAVNLRHSAAYQGVPIPDEVSKLASLELISNKDVIDERRVYHRPPRRSVTSPVAAKLAGFNLLSSAKEKWPDLQPHEKRAMALRISKTAEFIPTMQVPRHIHRYTGTQLSEKFASHMKRRLDYVRGEELRTEYQRLAKVASALHPDEVARLVFQLDANAGLRWRGGDRYGEKLADPYLCVYDAPPKEAEWSWTSGADYTNATQLEMLAANPEAREIFTSTFTDELWQKFKAGPVETFTSQPEHSQRLMARMANRHDG